MLPRKNRISKKEFPTSSMRGFRVFSPYFSAVFYKNATINSNNRAAVVVSKKTAKTAVVRNRIRRKFYDLVEIVFKECGVPITVVLYPKREAETAQLDDLKNEIHRAFKAASAIK